MRTTCVLGTTIALALVTVLSGVGVARAAEGAVLWEKTCAPCHGPDGKGDTKTGKLTKVRDLTAPDVHAKLTADKVRKIIVDGTTDTVTGATRMRGFKNKFSSDELDALSAYVLELVGAAQ